MLHRRFDSAESVVRDLLEYCRMSDWAGYDPYDALNSRILQILPFLNFKVFRLILTQGVKRSPVNLRPLLLVSKSANPKGIALFLSALVRLSKSGRVKVDDLILPLTEKLLALRSSTDRRSCWGYNFDWQQRAAFVPKGSPNIICSTFAGNALLDACEISPAPSWLNSAVSSADFILDKFFWREGGTKAFFSYTLHRKDEIHNANLLGAAYLCRIGRITGEEKYIHFALDAARSTCHKQGEDGSWVYGEAPTQNWIDNFHTGFVLVALKRINEFADTEEFIPAIRRGFDFYRAHFLREDGAPRYYHNATYPIDIHAVAQSLITFTELSNLAEDGHTVTQKVLDWALANMWDTRGFFYYQKRPHLTVRTPFMRWSQAWMLFALSTLLMNSGTDQVKIEVMGSDVARKKAY